MAPAGPETYLCARFLTIPNGKTENLASEVPRAHHSAAAYLLTYECKIARLQVLRIALFSIS